MKDSVYTFEDLLEELRLNEDAKEMIVMYEIAVNNDYIKLEEGF